MPSDFDLSKWLTAHTALLNESRVTWERKGYSVLTEGQNHFNLRGNSAVLVGKPRPGGPQRLEHPIWNIRDQGDGADASWLSILVNLDRS